MPVLWDTAEIPQLPKIFQEIFPRNSQSIPEGITDEISNGLAREMSQIKRIAKELPKMPKLKSQSGTGRIGIVFAGCCFEFCVTTNFVKKKWSFNQIQCFVELVLKISAGLFLDISPEIVTVIFFLNSCSDSFKNITRNFFRILKISTNAFLRFFHGVSLILQGFLRKLFQGFLQEFLEKILQKLLQKLLSGYFKEIYPGIPSEIAPRITSDTPLDVSETSQQILEQYFRESV